MFEDLILGKVRKDITFFLILPVLGILAAIAIPNWVAMREREMVADTRANMNTVQIAAEDFGVAQDGYYADAVEQPSSMTDPALLQHLPGMQLLENSFTGKRTEPRLGPEVETAPPGSIWYTPIPDSTGRITRYEITGFGAKGKLNWTLSSGGNVESSK